MEKYYPQIGAIYHHFKGGDYKVICLAKHSETDEEFVVYQSVSFGTTYVRPLSMWFDIIKVDDNVVTPRFKAL